MVASLQGHGSGDNYATERLGSADSAVTTGARGGMALAAGLDPGGSRRLLIIARQGRARAEYWQSQWHPN